MSGRYEERLPEELEPVAERLRAERMEVDPLQLDRLKRRVLARHTSPRGRLSFMKTRIATALTIIGLAAGTGGALAIAAGGHGNGGAANGQYRPGKGCGDRNHHHTGPPGNPGNNHCPPTSGPKNH
jgi:hypothetical protein